MSDIKPLVVVFDDKFNGIYSGGKWTAWNMCYVPSKIFGDEKECADFFAKENLIFGRGETPEEAIEDLKHMRYYGSHMTRERIKAVSESTDDEEDNEMEPTSVYRIEGINDIRINQDVDGMSLMLKNQDDLYKIVMTGDAIDNYNEQFVISLKKDEDTKDQEIKRKNREINELNQKLHQAIKDKERLTDKCNLYKAANEKIKENAAKLKKENEDLKKAYDILDDALNESQKYCNEWYEKYIDMKTNVEPFRSLERTLKEKQNLENKYNLEKAANEAQHKFFRQYAGNGVEIEFNYAINDCDEVSYVIVDKKEYKKNTLKGHDGNSLDENVALIHGVNYTVEGLVDRILELEKLKTSTIENFADEEPYSRRDILKAAEKCVCGQREQDYGTPESNFQLIADLWNDYLKKEQSSVVVDAMDVSMMMALLKIARIKNGRGSGDSFVDLAGYAACGGEIWAGQKYQKDLK